MSCQLIISIFNQLMIIQLWLSESKYSLFILKIICKWGFTDYGIC
jgi:hypothetical protein